MSIVFVSNYINHHQIPLSDCLYEISKGDYHFIQTVPMEEERIRLGWNPDAKEKSYVCCYYETPDECQKMIDEADAVIFGGVSDETYIAKRLAEGRMVIRYDERPYKNGQWRAISPKGLAHKYKEHVKYRKSPVYFLCAGAYVASDYHLIHAYPGKLLRFGYFPRVIEYGEQLNQLRDENSRTEILWVGRMIDWKHPEMMIELGKRLKTIGVKFHITMIGDGELFDSIQSDIYLNGMKLEFTLTGAILQTEVQAYMRKADIFVFTSDRKEGWGAVLNEAMNSGAAVVASHLAGATPYLVQSGENGLIFHSGNTKDMERKVEYLMNNSAKRRQMGENAYKTMVHTWNAQVAAKRLYTFIQDQTHQINNYTDNGPMTQAPIWRESTVAKRIGESCND